MGLFQNGYVPHLRKHIFSQDVSLFRKFNMGIPFLTKSQTNQCHNCSLVNRTRVYKVRKILERSHVSNTILYTFYFVCVCVKYQMCLS